MSASPGLLLGHAIAGIGVGLLIFNWRSLTNSVGRLPEPLQAAIYFSPIGGFLSIMLILRIAGYV